MAKYTVRARLRGVAPLEQEHFVRHVRRLERRLRCFSAVVTGTLEVYEVRVRVEAASEADALEHWWRDIEPVLDEERLGSTSATYFEPPEAAPSITAA